MKKHDSACSDLLLGWLALCLTGCFPGLVIPDDAVVLCTTQADCPKGRRCVVDVGVCVPEGSADTTPPTISNVLITPQNARAGVRVEVSFDVNEALLQTPKVSLVTAAATVEFLHDSTADSASGHFVFERTLLPSDPEGLANIIVRVIDQVGNSDQITAGTITVDHSVPRLNLGALLVTQAPPGTEDSVRGGPGFSDPGVTVSIYGDADLQNLVGSVEVDSDGGFEPVMLGDNHTDERGPGLVGQGRFWLRALGVSGNQTSPFSFDVDVEPPILSDAILAWLYQGPDDTAWVPTLAIGDVFFGSFVEHDVETALFIHISSEVESSPMVTIAGTELNIPCTLVSFEAGILLYRCAIDPTGTEDQQAQHIMHIDVVKRGSANVARVSIPGVMFDFARPQAPESSKVVVDMQPVGEHDGIAVLAGGMEPFAILELYGASWGISQGGAASCFLNVEHALSSDGNGAVAYTPIGDNPQGIGYLRQYDSAGNPSCECPIGLDGSFLCSGRAIRFVNDDRAPTIQRLQAPPLVAAERHADFRFAVTEDGPLDPMVADGITKITHPPTTFMCRLDAAAYAPCPTEFSHANLAPGAHVLRYYAHDALMNATPEQVYGWRIQPMQKVIDARQLGVASPQALVLDDLGKVHVFIGGDALYHFIIDAGAVSEEVLLQQAVGHVSARYVAGSLYVAYGLVASRDGTGNIYAVGLATGVAGDWQHRLVHEEPLRGDGFDLSVDVSGVATLLTQHCLTQSATTSPCHSNNATHQFRLARRTVSVDGGISELEVVPNTLGVQGPVVQGDADGVLWVVYESALFGGSRYIELIGRQASGIWSTPVRARNGSPVGNVSNGRKSLQLVAGSPVIAFSHTGGAVATRYDGAAFTAELSLNTSGGMGSAVAPDGRIWYGYPGMGSISLRVRSSDVDAPGTHSFSPSVLFNQPADALALAVSVPGDFSNVGLHMALTQNAYPGSQARYVERVAGVVDVLTLSPPSGVTAFAAVEGAVVPTLVAGAYEDALRLYTFDSENAFVAGAVVHDEPVGRGGSLDAIVANGTTWVAHTSTVDGSRTRVLVERDAGTGFESLGPVTDDDRSVQHLWLGRQSDGVPVLLYTDQLTNERRLLLRFWNGSAFSAPTLIRSLEPYWDLYDAALIADAGASSAAASDVWVALAFKVNGVSIARVEMVRVDTATENTATLACESCTTTTITDFPDGSSSIRAGLNAANRPTVWYTHSNQTSLNEASHNGTAWAVTELHPLMVPQRFDVEAGAWLDQFMSCQWSHAPWVTYGANGRRKMMLAARCSAFDSLPYYALGLEDDTGSILLYPIAGMNQGYIDGSGAIVEYQGEAVMVWPALADGDVWAFRESDF